jgi:hypothetical protein
MYQGGQQQNILAQQQQSSGRRCQQVLLYYASHCLIACCLLLLTVFLYAVHCTLYHGVGRWPLSWWRCSKQVWRCKTCPRDTNLLHVPVCH